MSRYWPLNLIIVLLLVPDYDAASGDSLRELRKLMRLQATQAAQTEQFNADMKNWAMELEQLSWEFTRFVEHCRRPNSRCDHQRFRQKLRVIRQQFNELRTRFEWLGKQYHLGELVNDIDVLQPTLHAVRMVLHRYAETLRMAYEQTYKLIEQ